MTTLTPLLEAAPVIQIHVASACAAILLAPINLFRRRRDHLHRMIGYTWVLSMALCALSSFWINGIRLIGPFSPIHVLSGLTLYSLWQGVHFARRGNIAAHRAAFRNLMIYALGGAGAFAVMPGRLMNEVLFAQLPELGYAALFLVAAWAVGGLSPRRRRRSFPPRHRG